MTTVQLVRVDVTLTTFGAARAIGIGFGIGSFFGFWLWP
jgi:hypothetical protein